MQIIVKSVTNVVEFRGCEAKLLAFQTRIPIVNLEKKFGWNNWSFFVTTKNQVEPTEDS